LLLADFEWRYSGGSGWWHFVKKSQSTTGIPPGILVFASHKTGKGNLAWINIYHMGIVVKVMGRNLMIAQHTKNTEEPLWAAAGKASWFNHNVTAVWAMDPGAWVYQDHSPDCDNYLTCNPGTP
jgi:hypothetical protein